MNDMTQPAEAVVDPILSRAEMNRTVREAAMLADVAISVWGAERTDRKIMEDAKAQAGAIGNVGRAIKNLLSGADENLKKTRAAFAACRAAHYALTLPFASDPSSDRMRGPRLLPNTLFMRYLTEMSRFQREANAALDAFIADYPADVLRAKANLGKLVDAVDYPDENEVRRLFKVEFDFAPISVGADFVGLPDHLLAKLSGKLQAKQDKAVACAKKAMWDTVRERVQALHDRLGDPEAKFRATTVAAVQDLTTLLPSWAIDGDPRATEIAEDLRSLLTDVTVTKLRSDPLVRAQASDDTQRVLTKLDEWGL